MKINVRNEYQKALKKKFDCDAKECTYQEFVLFWFCRYSLSSDTTYERDIDDIFKNEIYHNKNHIINKMWAESHPDKKDLKEITKPWNEVFD